MNKSAHKKPIGDDGPIRVSAPDGQAKIEWRKIEHSPEKREQETAIATAFVDALNEAESRPSRFRILKRITLILRSIQMMRKDI